MVFVSQEERIQRQLIAEAVTGPFHPVTYDSGTRNKTVDVDSTVAPAEKWAQSDSTSFGVPTNHRRTDRLEQKTWRWNLACSFNQEVSVEAFHKRLLKTLPILARDPANELAQVTLKLQSADQFHPPQQSPSKGTHVVFIFEAELSPV